MTLITAGLLGCGQPVVAQESGTRLRMGIRLLMRTSAGTERPVAAGRPVFSGDGLAFLVDGSDKLHVALVDQLEHSDAQVGNAILIGSAGRRLPAAGWVELHGRTPRALVAIVGSRTKMTATQSMTYARHALLGEGYDRLNVAFEPTPDARGLPRRNFVLRGRRLSRDGDRDGAVMVSVPADHEAIVAVLSIAER
jgi:hypothetical protein